MADKKRYPSQRQDRFLVRLPDGLRDRIAEEAKRNKRSMNAEVLSILERYYSGAVAEPKQAHEVVMPIIRENAHEMPCIRDIVHETMRGTILEIMREVIRAYDEPQRGANENASSIAVDEAQKR